MALVVGVATSPGLGLALAVSARVGRVVLVDLCTCLAVGGIAAVVGCRKERWLPTTGQDAAVAEPGPTGRGGGPSTAGPSAAEAMGVLATKRCERAARCGRIGPGGAYSDADRCRTAAKLALESERHLQRCAAGIDPRGLQACADALANGPCDAEDRAVSDREECQLRNLCIGER